MDFGIYDTLVKSIKSEGKVLLNAKQEILSRNAFISDLITRLGEDLVILRITQSLAKPSFIGDIQFRSISAGDFYIVTVTETRPAVMDSSRSDIGSTRITESNVAEVQKEVTVDTATTDATLNGIDKCGTCIFRLDTVTGSSTAVYVDEVFLKLVGNIDRKTVLEHGVPAVGNFCHPDDLAVSDVFAKDVIARRTRGSWPLRIYVDKEYRWRQYDISIECESDNERFVLMTSVMTDFTEQAAQMGLVSTPGMKVLEMPDGNRRHIPMVSSALTTEFNSAMPPDAFSPSDDDDASSASTRESMASLVSETASDVGNISCLKRYMSARLIHSIDVTLSEAFDSAYLQVEYISLDFAALFEELSLDLTVADYSALLNGVDVNDIGTCMHVLSQFSGCDFRTERSSEVLLHPHQTDKVALCFKFLIALSNRLSDQTQTTDLLRNLYQQLPVLTSLGGRYLTQLMSIELTLSLLTTAIKSGGEVFKARENYMWLASMMGSVIESIDSHDGLILQGMYWISVQWAYLHVVLGRVDLAVNIWRSTLEDVLQYIEQFPNTATVRKLEKIIRLNISIS